MSEARSSTTGTFDRTTAEIIREQACLRSEAPAFWAGDGAVLSYAALLRHIENVGEFLRYAGVGAGDWVAVALPDSMDLALMVVALTAYVTALPISADLAVAELDALFAADQLKGVIVANIDAPAAVSAQKRGLAIFVVARSPGGPSLSLQVSALTHRNDGRAIGPDTIAFILRTSGTTARPKLVAVTHRKFRRHGSCGPRMVCADGRRQGALRSSAPLLLRAEGGPVHDPPLGRQRDLRRTDNGRRLGRLARAFRTELVFSQPRRALRDP